MEGRTPNDGTYAMTMPGPRFEPTGQFTQMDGDDAYRIGGADRMPPFLMNLASDSDLWMFVTSRGGLTAGRVDAEGNLFPYETVDKLYDGHHHTGPITLLRVRRGTSNARMWQPFDPCVPPDDGVERNLYKNTLGNRLHFEELHDELELAFRYRWAASPAYGWVRTATLENRGSEPLEVEILDGLRNVLPHGAPLALYQRSSTLVDAYKRTDLDATLGLGTFALTSRIVDRPEASEELRANVVWCHGLPGLDVYLRADAIDSFRARQPLPNTQVLTGQRGNYFARATLALRPGDGARWHVVADVGQSHVQLAALRERLSAPEDLGRDLEQSLEQAHASLRRNVASADGLQHSGHAEIAVHHTANVLYNNMRGGVFAEHYAVARENFVDFVRVRNRDVADRHASRLEALPDALTAFELQEMARETGDVDLERLSYEYLPLYFGRRHGDPSRPWNTFRIAVRAPKGGRLLRYEGNWRDIFQNWEALAHSFPGFLPSFIAKFVNASTVDGFNPYRITRDGVDWETIDSRDPWSHIGYWGDHQIVYLLKFLEALPRYAPESLETLLTREIFAYADVPYRLEPYADIVRNPHHTIRYDAEHAAQVAARMESLGTDGQLVHDADGSIRHVNLLEKLLVPALSKLSNFVPDAGIWMNTQRPEWNDANNALVGHGVSMVTLCYLHRYLGFLADRLQRLDAREVALSAEVVTWMQELGETFDAERESGARDTARARILDARGAAFERYRERVYRDGFSKSATIAVEAIEDVLRRALVQVEAAIRANERDDALYHAYNVLDREDDRLGVGRLDLMLEGQVAALSSGLVGPSAAARLLTQLFESPLYRSDQRSFLLYPWRELPRFVDRNVAPRSSVERVPLLHALVDAGDTSIVECDALGFYRFHADSHNARNVERALDALAQEPRWSDAVRRDRDAVLEVFEETFAHHAFTGRSGTMYGFEGLGCIYWHMVAKLLLAVQEITLRAADAGEPIEALASLYHRIRDGLGFAKSPHEYGAFPTDPYSHTPLHAGAQQPGMTGQVKEEILTRWGELGVRVEDGRVRFRPVLLCRDEFGARPSTFVYHDLDGARQTLDVPVGALAFTLCQVPVVYQLSDREAWIRVHERDRSVSNGTHDRLDARTSRALFERRGTVRRLEVGIPQSWILD